MNYYVGSRTQVTASAAQVETLHSRLKPLGVAIAVLALEGERFTLGLLNGLEAWNPPADPYVHGSPLRGDGAYPDSPLGSFLPRHSFDRHYHRPEVRTAVADVGRELGLDLAGLLEPARLFMYWGGLDHRAPVPRMGPPEEWEAQHEWSLIAGFSTAKNAVLAQKKVQEGLRAAGFVVGQYAGSRKVFGRCVGTLKAGEVVRDVDLEPQLPAIAQAMQTFLTSAGQKLAPPGLPRDAVEAFLCWDAAPL